MNFGRENGAKLVPKWDQKSMSTWKGDFSKIVLSLQQGFNFSSSVGPSWKQTSTENRSKNGAQDGMHLGIDCHSILVGFGVQVWVEKQLKTDVEKHQKL